MVDLHLSLWVSLHACRSRTKGSKEEPSEVTSSPELQASIGWSGHQQSSSLTTWSLAAAGRGDVKTRTTVRARLFIAGGPTVLSVEVELNHLFIISLSHVFFRWKWSEAIRVVGLSSLAWTAWAHSAEAQYCNNLSCESRNFMGLHIQGPTSPRLQDFAGQARGPSPTLPSLSTGTFKRIMGFDCPKYRIH